MRRVASAAVAAAVGAVVLVAFVDAVERAADRELPARSLRLHFPDARTVLRGRLLWIDTRCRLHVTDVATLQQVEEPRRVSCRAELGPNGRLRPPHHARGGARNHALTHHGWPIRLPIRDARALVWSPDERWALAAGRRSLFLFRPGDVELRFRRLPIAARGLAWVRA